ncbi:MAG TPA: bifunctional alpha,alpha-trehalose-phosphate synthase (UDP-forming)/trehalose-phosphatase [Blastocatellia bacterium]|nr:bifunctional alpha,alpha-trehalose-phosphate synthase (UDP-forming)/trehalose-phosphatase [Blastocatellia bacterium]
MPNGDASRVVVVSNRLPITIKRAGQVWRTEQSPGGLATAMNPILKRTGGIWIGWSGDTSGVQDGRRRALLDRIREKDSYITVDLPPEIVTGFYDGLSNQVLWPVLHHFSYLMKFRPSEWAAYVEANKRFRDVVVENLKPGDLVWVHDYQLMLLPRMLREAVPDANIGFFLHVPFPSSAVFRIVPRRVELLEGLLGADYIAFHTHSYLQHFRNSLLRILGLGSSMDRVDLGQRTVALEALPIGIAPDEFTGLVRNDPEVSARIQELRTRFADLRVLVAVDRIDYTKGIPERLRTYRRLLEETPELRGKIVLVQVAVPSRERIPMYGQLRKEVDELVGKINGEFSSAEWTPIVYLRRGIPRNELVALYAVADLAWVAPLRDGLNLVCKEYVACKQGGDGALILSELAGAASEMGEAFLVNPFDEEQTAATVRLALQLSPDERRQRMMALHRRVLRNNVFAWGDRFVESLRKASALREERTGNQPQWLPVQAVCQSFQSAHQRLLLLDYDGTLVPYATRPEDANPPRSLLELLESLASQENTTVVLISGRSRADLGMWFGSDSKLWLAAEHGAMLRSPQSNDWQTHTILQPNNPQSNERRHRILSVLEHFTDRTPGSFIEEKECSLVWHYRMSDPEFGEWLAHELVANLDQMLADTELRAVHGHKSVEIRPLWAHKGQILSRLEGRIPVPDFILAAGDDRTDEDLFAELPTSAWTIHIGSSQSRARYRLHSSYQMVQLLQSLSLKKTVGSRQFRV